MTDQRMTHCDKCGKEYISGELDPDDFDADLEELGWTVPEETFDGGYICPDCNSLNVQQHKSDCAVYNEPAYPAGECDCGYPETKITEKKDV